MPPVSVSTSVNTSTSIIPSINLSTGTRIRSTFDFGLVTLAVNGLRPDDSAIYTCKATNLLGEAVSTCTLKVEGSKRKNISFQDCFICTVLWKEV